MVSGLGGGDNLKRKLNTVKDSDGFIAFYQHQDGQAGKSLFAGKWLLPIDKRLPMTVLGHESYRTVCAGQAIKPVRRHYVTLLPKGRPARKTVIPVCPTACCKIGGQLSHFPMGFMHIPCTSGLGLQESVAGQLCTFQIEGRVQTHKSQSPIFRHRHVCALCGLWRFRKADIGRPMCMRKP